MGGLSARQFIKFVKSTATVDSYVSLGTPQYGIYSACILPGWYGGQMCPTSGFLRDLNRGDDTPGRVAWTPIYSTSDEFVPNSASRLDGGAYDVQVSVSATTTWTMTPRSLPTSSRPWTDPARERSDDVALNSSAPRPAALSYPILRAISQM